MPDQSLLDDLRLAHLLADQADAITMARFKASDLQVSAKPDLSPVSDADHAVEDAIRTMLSRTRPRDAVHGEERADSGWGPRRWVIDPIDGTKNYVRGVPVWATLIGLMVGDRVVAGVVSAPALSRRWWAYPHACWGTQALSFHVLRFQGLSPRVWGNLFDLCAVPADDGPIPTRVGEPPRSQGRPL